MSLRDTVSRWFRRFFPRKSLGRRGERVAERYLKRRGYKILARSNRFAPGELDLVVLDKQTIVFVEVKTRRSAEQGHPLDAVGYRKQRRISLAAASFLKRYSLQEQPTRFDVVGIIWPEKKRSPTVEHIKNAFEAVW